MNETYPQPHSSHKRNSLLTNDHVVRSQSLRVSALSKGSTLLFKHWISILQRSDLSNFFKDELFLASDLYVLHERFH